MNKRIKVISLTVAFVMLLLCANTYRICMDTSVTASRISNERLERIVLANHRGCIYDRNMQPLAGKNIVSGVLVDPLLLKKSDIALLEANANSLSSEKLKKLIYASEPFYCGVNEPLNGDAFLNLSNNVRYLNPVAQNLIGYVDENGGVCGIERAYDEQLKSDESYSVVYRPDALGHLLDGLGFGIEGSLMGIDKGVVLTLDKEIQNICEAVADEMFERGAVIITETSSGEIVGCISRPTYNPSNVADYLSIDGALMNKTLNEFSCGSAFKIVVTAAALENSDEVNFSYTCTGKYDTGYEQIGCGGVHGNENLSEAFSVSCNTYFCNLAKQLGVKKVRSMALKMGFGKCADIGGIISEPGILPSLEVLSSPVAFANFSIGQGDILVTPIQINAMTNTIANGGVYIPLRVVKGTSDDGRKITENEYGNSRRIISEDTAKEIQKLMEYTTEKGTGILAMPYMYGAGTKTSTAETGIYENGKEIYHTWVTGFVPSAKPQYTITVLVEGGESGYSDASPVMKAIADKMIDAGIYTL